MQKTKKFLAVSCSHGQYINQDAANKILAFRDEYKPHSVLHLGDFVDCAAFRAGGTSNEGDIIADLEWGIKWVLDLAPTTLFYGNHEARLIRLSDSRNEMVSYAATEALNRIDRMTQKLKCDVVDYTGTYDPAAWRLLGNTAFGHGFLYNEQAARDHVEMIGRPVVFGHVHKILRQAGRMHGAPEGVCVGCVCDIPSMAYAANRRATAAWDLGYAWGEYTDEWCKVYVERIGQWQPSEIKRAK